MIKVLLVDDHELVRTGIEALLNKFEDISVVGVACSGEQALLFTEQFSPDVILMDVKMPGMGGMEACRRILRIHPLIKVIALSADTDAFILGQLLKLGAKGFVSKSSSVDEMVNAIRKVMSGEHYLRKDVADSLANSGNAGMSGNELFFRLSKRQKEVLSLILQGRSIPEMAHILSVNHKTINTYRYRIHEKLGVKDDLELTRLAIKSHYSDT